MVHCKIGVVQRPRNPVRNIVVGRLPHQVAPEQVSRRNLLGFEILHYVSTRERRARPHGNREAEPARIGTRRGLAKNEKLLETAQPFAELAEIALPRLAEPWQLAHLHYHG